MSANDNQPPVEVIELSPEASASLRWQYELDREQAGPKLPVDSFEYRKVMLESRFSVAHEFDSMKAAVDAMPDLIRARIGSIWCDSRACAFYVVTVISDRWVDGLEWDIRRAFLAATEGFNGLSVECGERQELFDPTWLGEEE